MTRLRTGKPGTSGVTAGRSKIPFSRRSDLLWGPPSLLFNSKRTLFPHSYSSWIVKLTRQLHPIPRLRTGRTTLPIPKVVGSVWGSNPRGGGRDIPISFRPSPWLIQPSVRWLPGLSLGVKRTGRDVTLTTHAPLSPGVVYGWSYTPTTPLACLAYKLPLASIPS